MIKATDTTFHPEPLLADLLQDSLEAAQVGTWTLDLATHTCLWNKPHERMMGYKTGTPVRHSEDFFRHIFIDDKDKVRGRVQTAIENQGTVHVEYRVMHPDGSVHWLLSRGRIFRDDHLQPVKIAGTTMEITEQKNLDQANRRSQRFLYDSEERYRSLVSVLSSIVWSTDPVGRVLSPQPPWEAYTGDIFDDYRDFRWIESLHPDDRDHFVANWARACHDQCDFKAEGRLWSREHQNYRHINARAVPLFNERGQIREWVGTISDIDDRYQAELALKKSEQRFRFALKNAPLVAAWMNDDLSYTWAHNPELMFGTSDITGRSDEELLNATSARQLRELKTRALTTGEPVREVISITSEQGKRFFDVTIEPLHSEDLTEISGLAMAAMDITVSKETESAALAASQAKSQFIANISHEIRTPIGIILGFSDLASELMSEHPIAQSYLNTIRKNGQHLLGLIGEILDLSKIEADRIELDLRACQIRRLLAEAIEGFSQAANEKQVEIRLDLQNLRSSTLLTDPMRLQQILNNVIGNAVKFTESGRIEITVIESADADSSKFRFLIQDTGIGIDSEQTGRLFLPFSQADGSFARRFGGTGLGLLLSKRLAQRLGGDLWLETSEPGKGSLFIVEIQCQTVVTDSRCPEMSSPMPKIEPRTLRLLLVEDSRDNQMIVKAYMRSLPLHVDIANNGEEGLIMAKQAHYDLILLDIQMPILDGYETLAQMRAHGLHTPIIALTAHAMNTERERALAAGFQDFITKPIHRNVLLQKVQHYLQDPDLVADST